MPVQATQMYNSGYEALMADGIFDADEFKWVLADDDYDPQLTHTTGADIGTDAITTGDLAPISATSVNIATISTAGYFQTADVSMSYTTGLDSYRYLVLTRTGGVAYSNSAELIFYIDLRGGTGNDTVVSGESVNVNMTNNGWFKMVQS